MGRCFLKETDCIPGHVTKLPLFIALTYVEIGGKPAQACRYFASSVLVWFFRMIAFAVGAYGTGGWSDC